MAPNQTEETRSGKRARQRTAPAPVPADIGVVAALPIEIGDLTDRLQRVRKYHSASISVIEGEQHGRIVAVAVAGVGRAAARLATELLVAGHQPRWLLSAGFAGALDPALRRNDIVLPHEIIDLEGRRFTVEVPDALAGQERHPHQRLLTVDRVILEHEEKQSLRRNFDAHCVDMESSAVADVCSHRLLRFLSVRVISDDASTTLPREVATILAHTGSYRVGAALRALWQRPGSLKDFWMMHERALEASEVLAKFIVKCLDDLAG
jgi:adenosylhomocysteine nucleosidase